MYPSSDTTGRPVVVVAEDAGVEPLVVGAEVVGGVIVLDGISGPLNEVVLVIIGLVDVWKPEGPSVVVGQGHVVTET
jgi:hypothetical protein